MVFRERWSVRIRETAAYRVVLHSRLGGLQGYKPGQMAAYKVSFLRDMNLLGSPRTRFGLLRVELIEGLGCGELAIFFESELILTICRGNQFILCELFRFSLLCNRA